MNNILVFSSLPDSASSIAAACSSVDEAHVSVATTQKNVVEQIVRCDLMAVVVELDEQHAWRPVLEVLSETLPDTPLIVVGQRGQESATAIALNNGAAAFLLRDQIDDFLAPMMTNLATIANHGCKKSLPDRLTQPTGRLEFVIPAVTSWVVPMARYLHGIAAHSIGLTKGSRVRFGFALQETLLDVVLHHALEMSRRERDEQPEAFATQVAARENAEDFSRRTIKAVLAWDEYSVSMSFEADGIQVDPTCGESAPEEFWNPSRRATILQTYAFDRAHVDASGKRFELGKYREASSSPAVTSLADKVTSTTPSAQAPHNQRGPHAAPDHLPRTEMARR